MEAKHLRFPLFLSLLLLYHLLFWGEKMGLNILIFTLAFGGGLAMLQPKWLRSRPALITAAGTLLAAALVLFYNSGTAKVVHLCSAVAFLGFAQEGELRSLLGALGTAFGNIFGAPIRAVKELLSQPRLGPFIKPALPYLKLSFFPLLILVVFFSIYMGANSRFSDLTFWVGESFAEWVASLFENFNFGWILFIILGALLLLGVVFPGGAKRFLKKDLKSSDEIQRIRKFKPFASFMGLRKEYRAGLMMLIMVNLLLFVVNLVDVSWIWIGFEVPEHFNLSQFVHEGTYLLILSILISMGLMLFFFRANQNFYAKAKALRIGSYIWIAQNIFLTLSVALRNYYYIDHHGLAYKRIGVIFFLILVVFGLVSLFLKIREKKSTWFLLRTNSWAVYAVVLLLALLNWDIIIAKYNISHTKDKDIDVPFLLTLSDKALPVLDQHRNLFSNDRIAHYSSRRTEIEELNWRIAGFYANQQDYSWVSWNLSDFKTKNYFSTGNQASQAGKDAYGLLTDRSAR